MSSNKLSKPTLLNLNGVNKSVRTGDGSELLIVSDVNLTLRESEILGLIGKSGSGKSTLLRVIAGLLPYSTGQIRYSGVNGVQPTCPKNWLSMVFQSFALFPWLTLFENVSIGLEAQNIPHDEATKRTLDALDLVGLDGYESAYPRELSGGMKQRVGFARALVIKPQILLLDEPFSALDILTAAALRAEFMDLYMAEKSWLKSVLMVTHNIEEAVLLCDRVLVMSSNPGKIINEIEVNIPHPRTRSDTAIKELIDHIYLIMANSLLDESILSVQPKTIYSEIPEVSHNVLNGFFETLTTSPYHGKADLPRLARTLNLTVDALFPILELLQILRFANVVAADVKLTSSGKTYAEADIDGRKKIFAGHLIDNVPIASYILQKLRESPRKKLKRSQIIKELEKGINQENADKLTNTIIGYGRYSEVFFYNQSSEIFYLE